MGGGNIRCKTTKFDITLILNINSIRQLGELFPTSHTIALKLVIVNNFREFEKPWKHFDNFTCKFSLNQQGNERPNSNFWKNVSNYNTFEK